MDFTETVRRIARFKITATTHAPEILWREAGDKHSTLWLFIVNDLLGTFLLPSRVRTQLLRLFIPGIHPRAIIRARVIFKSNNIKIGPGSVISYRTMFDTREGIILGSYVSVGADCRFLTSDHDMSNPLRRSGERLGAPISIGNGSRIAVAATVLPGAKIGTGAVVAAASVVRGVVEDNSLYAGTPAVKKRQLPT